MKLWNKRGKRKVSVLLALIMVFGMAIPLSPTARAEGSDDIYIVDSQGVGAATGTETGTGDVNRMLSPAPVSLAVTATVTDWDTLAAAVADTDVDTIVISNDIILDGVLEVSRSLIFEAADAGVTLTAKSDYRHINVTGEIIMLTFDGKVTLDGGYTEAAGDTSMGGISSTADNLTLEDAVIQNCNKHVSSGSLQGGGGVCASGILTLTGCIITSNSTTGGDEDNYAYGNGVYVDIDYDQIDDVFTVVGGKVSGNYYAGKSDISYNYGGGIYFRGAEMYINGGVKIDGNTAGNGGGLSGDCWCIYIEGSETSISGNTAYQGGGGVYVPNGPILIEGGEISGNVAYQGGGIFADYVEIGSDTLIGGEDNPNIAKTDNDGGGDNASGGGVYCNMLSMEGGEISYNQADHDGGGVYQNGDGYVIMTGGVISYNQAGRDGGGIHGDREINIERKSAPHRNYTSVQAANTSSDERIIYNEAGNNGGGVWCRYLLIGAGYISYNEAGNNGGGIYVQNSDTGEHGWGRMAAPDSLRVSVMGGSIDHNNAGMNGGGIYVQHRETDGSGGGHRMAREDASLPELSSVPAPDFPQVYIMDGSIDHNEAIEGNGGGIFTNVSTKMTGGVINYNKAMDGNGGGVYVYNKYYSQESESELDLEHDAVFQIDIGEICYNCAQNGGGVYLTKPVEGTEYDWELDYDVPRTYIIGMIAGDGSSDYEIYIVNNTAVKDGGGIYTEAFENYNNLNTDDYQNIETYSCVYFESNSAKAAYEPPAIANTYTNFDWETTSVDSIAASPHPINNYDINYVGSNPLPGTETYTVKYEANGGTGSYADESLAFGSKYTVKEKSATGINRSGWTFTSWNTQPGGTGTPYAPGAEFEITKDMILYAQWEYNGGGGGGVTPGTSTVTYHANGGTGSYRDTGISSGSSYKILKQSDTGITRDGYILTGWNSKADGSGTAYDPGDTITISSSITLYAQWNENAKPGSLDLSNHFAYIVGYPDGTVQPQGNITRAEVATIFFRLLTQKSREEIWSMTNSFPDVGSTDWHNKAISTLVNGSIIKGYPDGTFRPNVYMSRAELATIAAKFATVEDIANATGMASFSDISGHWAESYIALAGALGYVQGYGDGTFRPNEPITRVEVATLLNNVLNHHVESEDDLLDGMITWPDNQPGAWYYFDMQESTNSHFFDRKEAGINEVWTELRPAPDWAALEKPASAPGDGSN